jgi:uncharacterized membrane protein YraQ (UPF0718 family)
MNTLIHVFLGIILQAFPFLLIGILISSAIQVFIPGDAVARHFPRKVGMGMLVAVLFGFCLPVCDCVSVPVFRSLVRKGVPLPAAATFLLAAPVINPVVMLSTYYAYSGSLRAVAVRAGLGILSAVVIGLIFHIRPPKGEILSNGLHDEHCDCGCCGGHEEEKESRSRHFLSHSRSEFFQVGKYLVIGAFVSALFQTIGTRNLSLTDGAGYALSVFVMMVMAFLLSLCSSSDAVVARSFSADFSVGASMGFLVFGPMMDIKNVLMLLSGFSGRFVRRLAVTTFIVCYVVVFLLARPLLGV